MAKMAGDKSELLATFLHRTEEAVEVSSFCAQFRVEYLEGKGKKNEKLISNCEKTIILA